MIGCKDVSARSHWDLFRVHAKCKTISTSAYVANRPLKNSIMEIEVCIWTHCAIYHWQLHLVFTLIFVESTQQRTEGLGWGWGFSQRLWDILWVPQRAGSLDCTSESWISGLHLRELDPWIAPLRAGSLDCTLESWISLWLRDTAWGILTDTTDQCCLWPLEEGVHPSFFPKDCILYYCLNF